MNPISLQLTTPEARANCLAIISQIDDPDTVVTIKTIKEVRSAAQSRLRWLWMGYLEKELAGQGKGRDREQWNLVFKHKFMPSILISQDEDYADVFRVYDDTCKALEGKHKEIYQTQFWDKVISTEDMTVKSMSEWLDSIDKHVSENYGLQLPIPDDLMWLGQRVKK